MTENQLKEEIRKIIREDIKKDALNEVGTHDWRYLAIKKLWDRGSSFVRKKIGAAVAHNPNANWAKIDDYLKDMDYEEIVDAGEMLHLESINESPETYKKELETQLKWIQTKLKSNVSDKEKARYKKVALDTIDKLKKFSKTGKLEGAEKIAGGLSQNMDLNDIAEKHGISIDLLVAEFKKGIATEMEHTNSREVAKEIALDHLFEDPHYYTKLAQIEPVNEDLGGLAVKLIIAPLAAAAIGGLTKYIGGEIKQWWRNTKHKREFNQIIDRLRKDPEVVKAAKNPKGNFNSLIFSKLKPAEQKFAEFIYKKDFQNESVNEETAPEIIKDLDKVRNDLIKKVDVLIAKKKKLYSNVDITTPMSADEKQLDKDIQSIFSQIQQIILKKRSLKKESVNEAHTKGQLYVGDVKIGGNKVEVEVELVGADNKTKSFITKVIHIDKQYQNKLPIGSTLPIPARVFRFTGNWRKLKTPSVFEYIDDKGEERVAAALPQTEEEPTKKIGEAIHSHNHKADGTADHNFTQHHKSSMYAPDYGHPAELDTYDFDDDREVEPGYQTDTKDNQNKGYEPVKK